MSYYQTAAINFDKTELSKRIGKASSLMSPLSTRVWKNTKLTTDTKIAVYTACVLSNLLYGSKAWVTYMPDKSAGITASTSGVCVAYLGSPGRTQCPTRKYSRLPTPIVCLHC